MNWRTTMATAGRVLGQLRHDPRTVVMLLVVPSLLLTLFKYVFDSAPSVFDRVGISMLGVFPLIVMFLVTSVAMVRERTSGTLERLLTTPMHKLDLLLGYAIAFGFVALLQAVITTLVAIGPLGLTVESGVWVILILAVANALLGVAMGLFLSAFARTEFQAVQFMPVFVLPQILLCGLLAPRESMAPVLEGISDVLPMSYAVDGLTEARLNSTVTGHMVRDIVIVLGTGVIGLILGSATLRRRNR